MKRTVLSALAALLICSQPAISQTMEGVDFALDWRKLVKKRITVTGVRIYSADAEQATGKIQGGMLSFSLTGVPREQIRRLITECNMQFNNADCSYTVTGTVERSMLDFPKMTSVVLEPTPAAK